MSPNVKAILSSSSDPSAINWRARVATNGGTVGASTFAAVTKFCRDMKAAGLWAKCERINLMAGDQLDAALVPLKAGLGNATETNTGPFVSVDYTESTGLKGNGTTKSLNTGITLSMLNGDSMHYSFAGHTMATSGNASLLGAYGAAATFSGHMLNSWVSSGRRFYSDDNNATGPAAASSNSGILANAFVIGTRTSLSASALYQNGTSIATSALTITAPTGSTTITVFAENFNGSPANRESCYCRGYSIGSGLTAGEAASFNTIMEAFNDSLGRGLQ